MENLQKYLKHLPTCWTQQDYRELDDVCHPRHFQR